MVDFRRPPQQGISVASVGSPIKTGSVFDSIESVADTAIRGFEKVKRAKDDAANARSKAAQDAAEARNDAALGALEAGIVNREADLTFNVSQEQQAFNKAAIDSGIQADPEDPSFDAAGVRDLNGLATKTQNLAISQSQGRRLGAKEFALKELRSFVNARPDLAKEAVKVFKRNFGATPTELRLNSEKAQAEEMQRESERKERVGRDLLGATYRDELSPEQNWVTVIQTRGERVRVQEQKEHLEQLERDITKNDMERKLGQQEAFKNINFDRGVLASKARIDTLNFLEDNGIRGDQPMTREQGILAMGFLQDTIESLSVEYNNRFSRLPENERKAAIDAVTLPYKKILEAVSGQKSADNLKLIADNMGAMLASNARLSNEKLNTMMGLGINKFDPATISSTLKTVFGNRNSEQVVTGALMFPQNDAENKIAGALLGNATPNFTDLSDGAAELGKESSQVVKGYQSLMARSIQANLDNDASPKEQFQAANDYATMFTSFNIDAATAQSLGRTPKVTLKDNEQALLDWTNMSEEQLGVLNEHLTDEQKQHIDQARQKYSNDVLKATADLMAESLGSELVDGEAVQRDPVSIFTMLGDFAQELVGLVPDVPTVPAIVAEKVDFRSDGGNIRFFLKSQLDSTNPALIATLNKLNGPIADRLRLIQKTSIAGAEIGIPALIDDSKSVKRELAEEGIQADSQGITQAVGGDLAQNLGRMSDRLQARRDRLQKRIDKPDPFIAKQSPEVIERFNRQAEEDIVDIEEELELIDARLSGDSGAAERLEIVKANRLLESEKAGLQETIDSNKEQSGLGGRVPVSALNRIISKAEKDIAKIDKEIEKNNAELERLTPAVDANLTPEQVKEIRETVGFDAKVEKARSFGISDETLAPIIARFQ